MATIEGLLIDDPLFDVTFIVELPPILVDNKSNSLIFPVGAVACIVAFPPELLACPTPSITT